MENEENKYKIDHENSTKPPCLVFKMLRWFCPVHLLEEIEGDLIQKFKKDVKLFGERKLSVKFL